MLSERHDAKVPVFVDGGAGYDLALGDGTLEVRHYEELERRIPLRRVASVVVRRSVSPTLQALLELVERGAVVHFQNGEGHTSASLVAAEPVPDAAVRELVDRIDDACMHARYMEWQRLQLQHRASRIFHRGAVASIEALEEALARYAIRGSGRAQFQSVWNELRGLCFAWVDGQLTLKGLRPLVVALRRQQLDLVRDLDRILAIPLLWRFAPWVRFHPTHTPRERMEFFYRQHGHLTDCFSPAISALFHHLHVHSSAATYVVPRPSLTRQRRGGALP